jgi:hypothetical protein
MVEIVVAEAAVAQQLVFAIGVCTQALKAAVVAANKAILAPDVAHALSLIMKIM